MDVPALAEIPGEAAPWRGLAGEAGLTLSI